jgi:hypothetical protein
MTGKEGPKTHPQRKSAEDVWVPGYDRSPILVMRISDRAGEGGIFSRESSIPSAWRIDSAHLY